MQWFLSIVDKVALKKNYNVFQNNIILPNLLKKLQMYNLSILLLKQKNAKFDYFTPKTKFPL